MSTEKRIVGYREIIRRGKKYIVAVYNDGTFGKFLSDTEAMRYKLKSLKEKEKKGK